MYPARDLQSDSIDSDVDITKILHDMLKGRLGNCGNISGKLSCNGGECNMGHELTVLFAFHARDLKMELLWKAIEMCPSIYQKY